MKVCNKCGKELSINNFAKKKYRSGTIGTVVIFRSDLMHSVLPTEFEGERVTVALNYK